MSVKSPYTTNIERGGYTAIVYIDGSNYIAEDNAGTIIKADSDAATVIQAALDAIAASGGGKLVQLEGTYTWTTAVTYSASNLEWEGCGSVINDCSVIGGGGAVKIEGEITATNSVLTGDAVAGQMDVSVADASGFSVGDWIRIRSDEKFGSVYSLAEIQKIASIAGNVVTCEDVLAFAYTVVASGTIDLLTVYENITLKNMKCLGHYGVSNWVGFKLNVLSNVHVENVSWIDAYCYPIYVLNVVGFEMNGCLSQNTDEVGLGYGVVILNASRDVLIHHNKFYNCRHGIANGGDGTKRGIQTNQVYDSNIFRYSTQALGAIGGHSGYDGLVVSNCSVMNDGLGYFAGSNTTITGCNVYNDKCYNGAILANGLNTVITGNTLIQSLWAGTIKITTGTNILISGNYISGGRGCVYGDSNAHDVSIVDNILVGYHGVHIRTSESNIAVKGFVINGNYILTTNSGMRLEAYGYNIEDIQIGGNEIKVPVDVYGIGLSNLAGAGIIKNANVCGNHISGAWYGIYVSALTARFKISDNSIFECIYGIRISPSAGQNDYAVINNFIVGSAVDKAVVHSSQGAGRVYRQELDLFMDVLAVSATSIRSNEDLSGAIPITFTLDAQPDVPRTLSAHFDSHAQITEYDIEVIGVDAKGITVTETKDETDGWDWETSNAFATVTSIKVTSRTGTGVGDTMDIGITDVLGLSNIFYETGDVFKIKKNNANAVVVVGDVNTTYDTYDLHTIGLAATDDFTIWYKSNLNMIS